jgi:hypothetical protein
VNRVTPSIESNDDAASDVLEFERQVEAAIVRGDVDFVDRACAPTFVFSHGDGWTTGGEPFRVDRKVDWLAVVKAAPYASRDLHHVRVEMHGDVAITYGRYVARMKGGAPEQQQLDLWFERVYARRDGRWQYLSHRTVDGPHFSRLT